MLRPGREIDMNTTKLKDAAARRKPVKRCQPNAVSAFRCLDI
jgi:hypothetical protein